MSSRRGTPRWMAALLLVVIGGFGLDTVIREPTDVRPEPWERSERRFVTAYQCTASGINGGEPGYFGPIYFYDCRTYEVPKVAPPHGGSGVLLG